MPVTNYHTVNGKLRGETTSGARTNYLTDALGSVTASLQSAVVVNTYRYKPYGTWIAKTGAGPDPKFGWTGETGSRRTSLLASEQYNESRHLSTNHGVWTAVDSLWPTTSSYAYVSGNPTSAIDPAGTMEDFVRVKTKTNVTGIRGTLNLPAKAWVPTEFDKIMLYVGFGDNGEAGVSFARINKKCAWRAFVNPPNTNSPILQGVTCGSSLKLSLEIIMGPARKKIVRLIIQGIVIDAPWSGGASGGLGKTVFSDYYFRSADKTAHSLASWSNLQVKSEKWGAWLERDGFDKTVSGENVVAKYVPLAASLRATTQCACGPIPAGNVGHGEV